MLDHDDGDALGIRGEQQRQDFIDLAMREARHRLVGDQEFGSAGERARKLEPAQIDLCQFARVGARLPARPTR